MNHLRWDQVFSLTTSNPFVNLKINKVTTTKNSLARYQDNFIEIFNICNLINGAISVKKPITTFCKKISESQGLDNTKFQKSLFATSVRYS